MEDSGAVVKAKGADSAGDSAVAKERLPVEDSDSAADSGDRDTSQQTLPSQNCSVNCT